jgi:hypothetical protein
MTTALRRCGNDLAEHCVRSSDGDTSYDSKLDEISPV